MAIKDILLDERFTTAALKHPPLPFFHTCEAVYLQNILDSGELKPRFCKVYSEELLYLFYGRPAYRSSELANSRLSFMMPLCFIINYDAVSSMKRAVAFDSGAFDKYIGHLHKSMTREEFYLTPAKDTFNKMVDYFFENNEHYFSGQAKETLDYDPIHFQLESYHSIITADHKTEVDDRKSTMEVQLDIPIPLNNKTIDAIILPRYLALSPAVKQIITDKLNIPMISIPNYGVSAQQYYVSVLEETRKHLIEKKLLNDC